MGETALPKGARCEERGMRGGKKSLSGAKKVGSLSDLPRLDPVGVKGDVIFFALITSADGIGAIFNPQD